MKRIFAAAVLVAVSAACSSAHPSAAPTNTAGPDAVKPCGTPPSSDPAAELPAGFPALPGQVLYQPELLGKTRIVHGLINQTGFKDIRDQLVESLKALGYTIPGTDQEAVEAEAQFAGRLTGTIKVAPFCSGWVSVRYKFLG